MWTQKLRTQMCVCTLKKDLHEKDECMRTLLHWRFMCLHKKMHPCAHSCTGGLCVYTRMMHVFLYKHASYACIHLFHVGLFGVYIGLIWVRIGLFCWVYSWLFWVPIRFFWVPIGRFWVYIGLFRVCIWLFWVYAGLFWVHMGLFFSVYRALLSVYIAFLSVRRALFAHVNVKRGSLIVHRALLSLLRFFCTHVCIH